MSRRATLNVQLVGQTVHYEPYNMDDGTYNPIFVPDPTTNLGHDDSNEPQGSSMFGMYDGQALVEFAGRACYQSFDRPREKTATNRGYMHNILEVGHFSVLEHGSVSFYIQGVSRTLTHELVRHRHLSPSQLSQRFVDGKTARFVVPKLLERWVDEQVAKAHPDPTTPEAVADRDRSLDYIADEIMDQAAKEYGDLEDALKADFDGLKVKEIREAARSVLPGGTETKLVMSGNYRAWMHFLQKRDHPAADAEIQALAKQIGHLLSEVAPNIFDSESRAIWNGKEL